MRLTKNNQNIIVQVVRVSKYDIIDLSRIQITKYAISNLVQLSYRVCISQWANAVGIR